jgi:hypothetical protein
MSNQATVTRTMTVSDAKNLLSALGNEGSCNRIRVIVEEAGVPIAALVSVDDLVRLQELDRKWEEGTRAIERFSAAFADVSTEEAEAEIARILADLRRQDAIEAERRSA